MRPLLFWVIPPLLALLSGSCRAQFFADEFERGFNAAVACSLQFSDAASGSVNPASLSRSTAFSAAVYSEKRYQLKELATGALQIAFPAAHGGLGFAGRSSGSPALNTARLGVLYGRRLGKVVDLGMSVNYHLVHVAGGYGNAAAIGAEVAVNISATPALHVSLRVSNPAGGHYGHITQEKLPSVYAMSLAYELSQSLLLSLETRKTEHQPVDILMAVHYAFVKAFFVRAGLSSAAGNMFTGFGLSWNGMRFDFVASYHTQLGLTPGIQFLMGLQKKDE